MHRIWVIFSSNTETVVFTGTDSEFTTLDGSHQRIAVNAQGHDNVTLIFSNSYVRMIHLALSCLLEQVHGCTREVETVERDFSRETPWLPF